MLSLVRHLGFLVFLFLSVFSAYSFAEEDFETLVNENGYLISSVQSSYALRYHPTTGLIYQIYNTKNGEKKNVVKGFAPIRNLSLDEVRVIVEDKNFLLIQHGPWTTLLNTKESKVVFQNIGPFEKWHGSNERFSKIIYQDEVSKKPFAATFLAETNLQGSASPKKVLIVYDFESKKVGYFYLKNLEKLQSVTESVYFIEENNSRGLQISLGFKENQSREKDGILRVEDQRKVNLLIDFKTQLISQTSSPFSIIDHESPMTQKQPYLVYEKPSEFIARHYVLGYSFKGFVDTAQKGDAEFKKGILSQIEFQNALIQGQKESLWQSFADIHGQEKAKEALILAASNQLIDSSKFNVFLLSGPTGVGKNSLVYRYFKTKFPHSKDPIYEVQLGQFENKAFLSTHLFGSAQGYIGMGLTGLMSWVIAHPEGGGIFFDELDKMPIEGQSILLNLIERGEIKINPAIVESLIKQYSDFPKSEWPEFLREGHENNEGREQFEIILKLDPAKYEFAFSSNAGAWLYNSLEKSNQGHYDNEELKRINKKINADVIKKELADSGFKNEFINRISTIVPFTMLTFEEHSQVVEDRVREAIKLFHENFLVETSLTPALLDFLKENTFDPPSGMRAVDSLIRQWIQLPLNEQIAIKMNIAPDSNVRLDILPGNQFEKPKLILLSSKDEKNWLKVEEYQISLKMPPDVRPVLEYAKQNLDKVFKKRIIGHTEETDAIRNLILSRLKKAARDPHARDRYVEMFYEEGPPGNGKTERARAAAEGVFGDSKAFVVIDGNSIATYEDFLERAVKPLIDASQKHPEGLYVLFDEFPRMGDAHPAYRQVIQNALLSIVDKGELPPVPGATRMVNGKLEQDVRKGTLPMFTVFHATGNLFEKTLTRDAEMMSNRQLHAETRYLKRHPERFRSVFEQYFIAALRSRIGDPIIGMPLLDSEVELLRDRFFAQLVQEPMKKLGVEISLSDSAKKFFVEHYVPIRGGRWVRKQINTLFEGPIVGSLEDSFLRPEVKNSRFEIEFNEATKEISVVAKDKSSGKFQGRMVISKFKATRTEYSKESIAKTEYMVRVHEAGHAIVERAVINAPYAVQEINVFGGPNGGWMEPNMDVSGREIYTSSRSGLLHIAVLLGGHVAEKTFLGKTTVGAGSDFERTRTTAAWMISDGGVLGNTPTALFVNPGSMKIEPTEKNKFQIENKIFHLMEAGGDLAEWIIDHNRALLLEVADQLGVNEDLAMNAEQFEKIVSGRIVVPTEQDIKNILTKTHARKKVCQTLLLPKYQHETTWEWIKKKLSW